MATISLCMIVKNEEKILRRCIDSLKGIYDEAIIVDTGSTDSTRKIAAEYTDKVFDFEWVDDFSKARNFAMSKATCDYIYMADADEVLDEENRQKFMILKKALDGQVEVVQMYYVNQLSKGSVYNYDREPRAKLYKRVRSFQFVDPIHEVIREAPVVFDSDIEIQHLQEESHAGRDLKVFRKAVEREGVLSNRLIEMYARELVLAGEPDDFFAAKEYFTDLAETSEISPDILRMIFVVLAKTAILENNDVSVLKYCLKDIASEGSSEICCLLGEFFEGSGDLNEAAMWYYNARYETKPILDLKTGTTKPLEALIAIYEKMGLNEQAEEYKRELASL